MKIPVFAENDISRKLTQQQIKLALSSAFKGLMEHSASQPAQVVIEFPDSMGDCILYAGLLWYQQVLGVKVSPYIIHESSQNKVTAFTLLMSTETGYPLLLCDSLTLTTLRTAATTSLALDYLIPSGASKLSILGSGNMGIAHLNYVGSQHDWQKIVMYSPNLGENQEKKDRIKLYADSLHLSIEFANSAREAVSDSDVVLLCTSSPVPVINHQWLKPTAVVTSVGTVKPNAYELNPEALKEFEIYCDFRQTAPTTSAEMRIAIEQGIWSKDDIIADLPELVTGTFHPNLNSSQKIYFRSTGLGIEDIAIASLLLGE